MKALLEDELREVRQRLGDLVSDRPDDLGGSLVEDRPDCASANQVQFVSAIEQEALTRKRRLLEGALERLVDGQYGICQDCGQKISDKRLEVLPWAETCVACQGNREVRAAKARAYEQLPLRLLARPRRDVERFHL